MSCLDILFFFLWQNYSQVSWYNKHMKQSTTPHSIFPFLTTYPNCLICNAIICFGNNIWSMWNWMSFFTCKKKKVCSFASNNWNWICSMGCWYSVHFNVCCYNLFNIYDDRKFARSVQTIGLYKYAAREVFSFQMKVKHIYRILNIELHVEECEWFRTFNRGLL